MSGVPAWSHPYLHPSFLQEAKFLPGSVVDSSSNDRCRSLSSFNFNLMTTANRPTWVPAKGGANRTVIPTRSYSAKDEPGHTVLKHRKAE
jgi:hypothetical protein